MKVVEHYITRNYTPGRPGLDMPLFYVIHTYNGKGGFLGNVNGSGWFQNNNLGLSSSNCVLLDGTIERVVRPEDTPHANGNWWANVRSITYELQDNGNPSDSTRTPEQYEAVSQDIAQDAFKRGYKDINVSNVKPHSDFAETGCPGAVDMNRIITRANDILHTLLKPPIPEWKKNAINTGDMTFKIQKNVDLVNFVTGEKQQEFLLEGTEVTVRYLTQGYYVTQSSFDGNRPTGFLKEDLEYIKPPVVVPPTNDPVIEPEKPPVTPEPEVPTIPKFNLLKYLYNLIITLFKR